MTKKYILVNYNDYDEMELQTNFFTKEEVEKLANETYYSYYTDLCADTKEELIQKAMKLRKVESLVDLMDCEGYAEDELEEFEKNCIKLEFVHQFQCYEIGENELIYIEELSNY